HNLVIERGVAIGGFEPRVDSLLQFQFRLDEIEIKEVANFYGLVVALVTWAIEPADALFEHHWIPCEIEVKDCPGILEILADRNSVGAYQHRHVVRWREVACGTDVARFDSVLMPGSRRKSPQYLVACCLTPIQLNRRLPAFGRAHDEADATLSNGVVLPQSFVDRERRIRELANEENLSLALNTLAHKPSDKGELGISVEE